jgi:hypothetical protein
LSTGVNPLDKNAKIKTVRSTQMTILDPPPPIISKSGTLWWNKGNMGIY